MKSLYALIITLALATTIAADDQISSLQGLNSPVYTVVETDEPERIWHLHTRLPEGYSESDKSYPIVYLLDGGHTFPMLSSFYRYLNLGGELPDLIIVGISYGNDNFGEGNYRSTDFTLPSEREWWGGAPAFLEALDKTIMPAVEKNLRVDTSRRIVFGQSLGGQFVLYAAMQKDSGFSGFIASNPALHRNLELFTDKAEITADIQRRLFVASGTADMARFRDPAVAWINYWQDGRKLPWTMQVEHLEGASHFSAAPEAFRRGLKWIFKAQPEN